MKLPKMKEETINVKTIEGAACPVCKTFHRNTAKVLACKCGYFDKDIYILGTNGNLVNKEKLLNKNKRLERELKIKQIKQQK